MIITGIVYGFLNMCKILRNSYARKILSNFKGLKSHPIHGLKQKKTFHIKNQSLSFQNMLSGQHMKWIFGNAKFTVPLECNLIFLTWQWRGSARHKSILQQIFQLQLLKELTEMSSNLKKNIFVKLNRLRSYWAVNFVFSATL